MNHLPFLSPEEELATRETREKIGALVKANPWLEYHRFAARIKSTHNANASGKVKRSRFIQIAKELDEAVAPFAPCKKGCSHCCNGYTMIIKHEAELLARVSGRPMAHVPPPTHEDLARHRDFTFAPCPFLVDNLCSVYEHRPMACRLTHSLNENADACAVNDPDVVRVNRYEVEFLMQAYDELAEKIDYRDVVGTIIAFFPPTQS